MIFFPLLAHLLIKIPINPNSLYCSLFIMFSMTYCTSGSILTQIYSHNSLFLHYIFYQFSHYSSACMTPTLPDPCKHKHPPLFSQTQDKVSGTHYPSVCWKRLFPALSWP